MESAGRHVSTYGIAALLAVVPLVYVTDIYGYTLLPKRLAFYGLLTIAATGWLLRSISSNQTISLGLPTLLATAYGALTVVSLFNTTHTTAAHVELTFTICLLGLYLIGTRATNGDIGIWLDALIISGLLSSAIGVLQYFDLAFGQMPTNGKPSSTFGYRNFAAMFLVSAIPACTFRFLYARGWRVLLYAASGTLCTLFLLYTRTRGAWLGTAVGLTLSIVVFLYFGDLRAIMTDALRDRLKIIVGAGSAIAIMIAADMQPGFTDQGLQRFDDKKSSFGVTLKSTFTSTDDRGRRLMWERSLNLVWDHLFTGVGPGHWQYVYPNYDKGAMVRPDSSPKRPHNDFIWIASEHGLFALIAYLAFLALVLVSAVGKRNNSNGSEQWKAIAIATVLGVSVHAFFSFPKEQPQVIAPFFLLAGVAAGSAPGRSIATTPIAAALIVLSAYGSYITWRHLSFDYHYLAALLSEDSENWSGMQNHAKVGLESGDFRSHMYVILGRAHEKQGHFDQAEAAYEQTLQIAPHSWHAHNGLGIVNKRRGNNETAMVHYERALELSPFSSSVRTNLGALYRSMGNDDRAEGLFRRVLTSEPADKGANNNLANILKARGDLDSAEVYYLKALKSDPTFPQANQNLGDLLMSQKRSSEAADRYIAALEGSPNNSHIYWSLGQALEANANVRSAEAHYREAIRLEPGFPRPYFSLGTMLYSLHRWQETIELFGKFKTLWKGDSKFVEFADKRIKASQDWIARMDKK